MSVVALHHILVKSSALAEEILQELKLGADFGQLAREYSSCPSGQNEGFAGYHSIDDLDEALVKAIHDGEEGYVPKPIQTRLGFHLLKRVKERKNTLLFDS